jgi:hypothetical protein
MTIKLDSLLQGTELIRDAEGNVVVQSIRNMEIAFLTCPDEYSRDGEFADPLRVAASNTSYGNLTLKNDEDKDMIVAPQVAVFAKRAQNHALPKSAYVPAVSRGVRVVRSRAVT